MGWLSNNTLKDILLYTYFGKVVHNHRLLIIILKPKISSAREAPIIFTKNLL